MSATCDRFSVPIESLAEFILEIHLIQFIRLSRINRELEISIYLNNRVFLSRNYRLIVSSGKFDVFKTNKSFEGKYASFKVDGNIFQYFSRPRV